jgi:hypothetical protein
MWRFNVPGKNCLLEKTNQVDFFIRTYLVGPPKLPRRVYTRYTPHTDHYTDHAEHTFPCLRTY